MVTKNPGYLKSDTTDGSEQNSNHSLAEYITDGGVSVESASDEPTDAERGVQTAYRATCHDCSWTRTRTDVIEADELGAEHYRAKNHLTETIEVETAASPERSEPADFGGGEGGIDEL